MGIRSRLPRWGKHAAACAFLSLLLAGCPARVAAAEQQQSEHRALATPVDKMSVNELRLHIAAAGLPSADCVEKSDLRARAHKATTILARKDSRPIHTSANTQGGEEHKQKAARWKAGAGEYRAAAEGGPVGRSSLQSKDKTSLLHSYASLGDVASARAYLKLSQSDVDQVIGGMTPLIHAAIGNHSGMIALLVDAGADVEISISSAADKFGAEGGTALIISSFQGCVECVRILLAAGADPDAQTASAGNRGGESALMHAALRNDKRTAQLLLSGGATPDLLDDNDRTAFSYALDAALDQDFDRYYMEGHVEFWKQWLFTTAHKGRKSVKKAVIAFIVEHELAEFQHLKNMKNAMKKDSLYDAVKSFMDELSDAQLSQLQDRLNNHVPIEEAEEVEDAQTAEDARSLETDFDTLHVSYYDLVIDCSMSISVLWTALQLRSWACGRIIHRNTQPIPSVIDLALRQPWATYTFVQLVLVVPYVALDMSLYMSQYADLLYQYVTTWSIMGLVIGVVMTHGRAIQKQPCMTVVTIVQVFQHYRDGTISSSNDAAVTVVMCVDCIQSICIVPSLYYGVLPICIRMYRTCCLKTTNDNVLAFSRMVTPERKAFDLVCWGVAALLLMELFHGWRPKHNHRMIWSVFFTKCMYCAKVLAAFALISTLNLRTSPPPPPQLPSTLRQLQQQKRQHRQQRQRRQRQRRQRGQQLEEEQAADAEYQQGDTLTPLHSCCSLTRVKANLMLRTVGREFCKCMSEAARCFSILTHTCSLARCCVARVLTLMGRVKSCLVSSETTLAEETNQPEIRSEEGGDPSDSEEQQAEQVEIKDSTLQIFIKMSQQTIMLMVSLTDTIEMVRDQLYSKEAIHPGSSHLVLRFGSRNLVDGTLADYNIRKESTLECTIQPKKKKVDLDYGSLQLFLEETKCLNLLEKLKDNQVDLAALLLHTEDDLKDLGVAKGPRVKILRGQAARQRREDAASRVTAIPPPQDMLCPISRELMEDPFTTQNGSTYEKQQIEFWLRTNDTDPKTNVQLHSKKLVPNQFAKAAIQKWREDHPNYDN
jgi:hypothetical protein